MNPRTPRQNRIDFIKNNLGEFVCLMQMHLQGKGPEDPFPYATEISELTKAIYDSLGEHKCRWLVSVNKNDIPVERLSDSLIYGDERAIEVLVDAHEAKIGKKLDELIKKCGGNAQSKISYGQMSLKLNQHPDAVFAFRQIQQCRNEVLAYQKYLNDDIGSKHPEASKIVEDKKTRAKLQCLEEMLVILNNKDVDLKDPRDAQNLLGDFDKKFRSSIPLLSARRDSHLKTFLKVIGTILAGVSLVAAYKIPGIWETKGGKMVEKIKPIINPKSGKKS